MRALIIGSGEVGRSLYEVLSLKHEVYTRDVENVELDNVEVLNICYPCKDQKSFVEQTKKYIDQYKPKVTIIHSTVAPGTTRLCGKGVVHSPIHGKHPDLSGGIKTFTKYIGSHDTAALYLADKFLFEAGITTDVVSSPEASELSKLLCTTYYGWNIVFMKEVMKICEEYNVPFHEVYTRWNMFYNDGYTKLGMSKFARPVLDPVSGEIGGHCVVPNCNLVKSFITDTIRERNKLYKEENHGGKHTKNRTPDKDLAQG